MSGTVIIPFVDGKTGKAYQVNDSITSNRLDELAKQGLVKVEKTKTEPAKTKKPAK